MFWDQVAPLYDVFEKVYNSKVYCNTGLRVAKEIEPGDTVLECACGTGEITRYLAPACKRLIATDFSRNMLAQAQKKCADYDNIKFRFADLTHLRCGDGRFDKVVAGNVIHLLDDPAAAVEELRRVCKPGGKVIIPTYINETSGQSRIAANLLQCLGADFKRDFDLISYREFFAQIGYPQVAIDVVQGRMPCAVAVIHKPVSISRANADPIRKAAPQDAGRIAEIIVTDYRENFYPIFRNEEYYFKELNVTDLAAEYAAGSEALGNTYVYDDGVIKGMIRIRGREIEKLFVEPHFQGQGIGAMLLAFAVERFRADHLWALEYNSRGISFYQRHGFTLTGEREIEDEWVPLVKMAREMPQSLN